ncbi:hypothetical protein [Streptomyces luteocolor]|uniref:hypothetical protein n=1 Tax=Streptomyces luteocolor TaxID=285500 RepID=UPI00085321B7|nr:hypothetical protein [Streptomyces luteocolor]
MNRPPFQHGSGTEGAGEQLGLELTRLSELVRYAQDAIELAAEDADVFMTLYTVLIHGVSRRNSTDPALCDMAEQAIADTAVEAPREQLRTAAKLLVTVWSSSRVPGAEAKEWAVNAPQLAIRCLRAAVLPPRPLPLPD